MFAARAARAISPALKVIAPMSQRLPKLVSARHHSLDFARQRFDVWLSKKPEASLSGFQFGVKSFDFMFDLSDQRARQSVVQPLLDALQPTATQIFQRAGRAADKSADLLARFNAWLLDHPLKPLKFVIFENAGGLLRIFDERQDTTHAVDALRMKRPSGRDDPSGRSG
ncbi:hypothetical protein [Terrarubrum flagellatum]|uniref:hypothetical protein n=1 Tax=Terrirubrum flagellatum TaxID=2895980 RepID=UPI003144EAF3